MSNLVGDFMLQRLSAWGVKRGLYDAKRGHQPVVAIVGQQPPWGRVTIATDGAAPMTCCSFIYEC